MRIPSRLRRARWWWGAAVVLAAVMVYLNSLANGFAFDDVYVIREAWVYQQWRGVGSTLFAPWWPVLPPEQALWRPVTQLTFAVDRVMAGGLHAGVFHATNVLWHAIATGLVFSLVLALRAPVVAAGLGALIFAVHPVHVEAVSNLVGRAEVLATVFVLAGVRVALSRWGPRVLRWLTVAACYALALGAKESGVALPALVAIALGAQAWERRDREALRPVRAWATQVGRVLLAHIPLWLLLFTVLALYLGLRLQVLGTLRGSQVAIGLESARGLTLVASGVQVWPSLVRLLLWPARLSAEYGPSVFMMVTWRSIWPWLGLATGALMLAATAWGARRTQSAWPVLALGWFAASYALLANLAFPVGVFLAERTLYLASAALAFVVPAVTTRYRLVAMQRHRTVRYLALGGAAALLLLASWRTWTRTPVWRSHVTVRRSIQADAPMSFRALLWQGMELTSTGRPGEALPLLQRAAVLAPDNVDVHLWHAAAVADLGRPAEALAIARAAYTPSHLFGSSAVLTYALMAGRAAEVRAVADTVMRRYAWHADAVRQAAAVYEAAGDTAAAASARAVLARLGPRDRLRAAAVRRLQE